MPITRSGETLPLTKKRTAELARQARRYGYQVDRAPAGQAHGSTISVACPLVGPEWSDRHRITAELSMYSSTGLSVLKTLDVAVAEHLDAENMVALGAEGWQHACPGMRPVENAY